jgi:hypothetical protein
LYPLCFINDICDVCGFAYVRVKNSSL